jgi:hypothetical protein
MCRYNTLHKSTHGYVIKCNECTNIQVAFGTTALTLSLKQFNDFIGIVDDLLVTHQSYDFPDQMTIVIPTLSRSVSMICSVNELGNLKQLLMKGKKSLEMAKLFIFYEN